MISNEKIAQVAHEVNRAFCAANGDTSHLKWEDAPEWQRKSAIDGVEHFLANRDITPEETHEHWMKYKTENGWTQGPVKDEAKKEHPSMMPYSDLPLEEKIKDHLFRGVVGAMIED